MPADRSDKMPHREELKGEGFILRPCRFSDTVGHYEAVSESLEELSAWTSWATPGYSKKKSEDWLHMVIQAWDKGLEYSFSVIDEASGELIGWCGITDICGLPHKKANLGYWIKTSKTGKGTAAKAARLLARWGLKNLGVNRIEIAAAIGNAPSIKTAENSGAKYEGVLRNLLILRGRPLDGVMFSFVKGDFGEE